MKGKIVLSSEEQLHIIQSGVAGLTPLEAMKKKLDRGTPLNIKLGVEQTTHDLHIGHPVTQPNLLQFHHL